MKDEIEKHFRFLVDKSNWSTKTTPSKERKVIFFPGEPVDQRSLSKIVSPSFDEIQEYTFVSLVLACFLDNFQTCNQSSIKVLEFFCDFQLSPDCR